MTDAPIQITNDSTAAGWLRSLKTARVVGGVTQVNMAPDDVDLFIAALKRDCSALDLAVAKVDYRIRADRLDRIWSRWSMFWFAIAFSVQMQAAVTPAASYVARFFHG